MKKIYLFLAGALAITTTIPDLFTPELSAEYEAPLTVTVEEQDIQKETARQPVISILQKNVASLKAAGDLTATNSVVVENQQLPEGASAGDVLTYTVRIKNNAPGNATGVRFSSTLEENLTLVPGSLKITPIAIDDEYQTIGNVDLDIPASIGLLANDLSPDGTALSITSGPAVTTSAGATVTINQTTGAFTYQPNPGFTGEDTFTYTVQSTTGYPVTANVKIAAQGRVWFINTATNVGATERNGTLKRPFKSVDGFQNRNDNQPNRPGNNDYIFIYSGNYTGSITLLEGQRLIGQGINTVLHQLEGLSLPSGINMLPSTGGVNPVINSSAATAIVLGQNNLIRSIDITSSSNSNTKIRGNNFSTLKLSEVNLSGSGPALNLQSGNLTADFSGISATTTNSSAIILNNISGRINSFTGNIVSNNASAILISGSSTSRPQLGMQFQSVSSSGAAKGIAISNVTGNFSVNGTGQIGGSGGTIQNISLRGAEFINAEGITLVNMNFTNANTSQGTLTAPGNNVNCNAAVYANAVTNLALDRVVISGTTAEQGINLYETTGFRFENSTISNAGTGINQEHGGIYAISTTGNVLLKNSTVSNASGRLVYFYNDKPAALNIEIDDSDFVNASNGTGILMEGAGSAVMSMKIHNNSRIENFMTSAVAVYANQTANMKLDLLNCNIIGNEASGQGIDLGAGGTNGKIYFNIKNNNIKAGGYAAVANTIFENGYLEGTYDNNTIEIIGGFKDGIVIENFGGGISAGNRGIIRIVNNTLDFVNGNALRVNNRSTLTDRIDLTIENNIIGADAANRGFVIDAGNENAAANRGVVCLDVESNTITQNGMISDGLMSIRTGGSAQSQILLTGAADVLSAWNTNNNIPAGTNAGNTSVIKSGVGGVTVTGSCQVPSNPALRVMSENPIARAPEISGENSPVLAGGGSPVTKVASPVSEVDDVVSGRSKENARVSQTTAGETILVEGNGSGFIIPGGSEVEIKYSAVINSDIPVNICEVTNMGVVSATGVDPLQTNTVVTAVVSEPAFTLTTLPTVTLNPTAGTCTFTQSVPFEISTTGCPEPQLTFSVGGTDIIFPYQFPEGNTVVGVTASNGVGTDAVSSFTVTGQPLVAPVISGQPENQTVCMGSNASFSVSTENEDVSYQWQQMGTAGFEDILLLDNATAQSATLVIENVQLTDDSRTYRCIVFNPCAEEISEVALLNVTQISGVTLTGTTNVIKNEVAPLVTFSASNGKGPFRFTYTINGGPVQSIVSTESENTVTVAQPTDVIGEFIYTLISVSDDLGCSFIPAETMSATITVEVDLPVTLMEFNVTSVENTALLTWQTSAEINTREFRIERSNDATNWVNIGAIKATGDSNKELVYKWTDSLPLPGINYYRLKMVDNDGSYENSMFRSVNIEDFPHNHSLVVYPNPAKDRLNLDVDLKKVAFVEVLDVTGRRILKQLQPLATVEVSSLKAGVYFLHVRFSDSSSVIRKIIISR